MGPQVDPLRRTGRTTRMLMRAVEQVRAGKRVIVVAANSHHFGGMRDALRRNGVRVGSDTPIRFVSACNSSALRGLRADTCAVFVDHFVWELDDRVIARELYEYMRFSPGLVHE